VSRGVGVEPPTATQGRWRARPPPPPPRVPTGVMFMHHERLSLISRRLYEDKSVGDLRRVNTSFSFPAHLAPDFMSQGRW
jgi:hypothetical protein